MNNLALATAETGRGSEAISMLEEVLQRRNAKLGRDHPDTLKTINDLATLYLEASRWGQAEPLLNACLKLRESKKSDDWRLYQTMSQLGAALAGQNKRAEAEPLLIRGYEGLKARELKIPFFRRKEVSEAAARLGAVSRTHLIEPEDDRQDDRGNQPEDSQDEPCQGQAPSRDRPVRLRDLREGHGTENRRQQAADPAKPQ
jgi:hypothetical protein